VRIFSTRRGLSGDYFALRLSHALASSTPALQPNADIVQLRIEIQ
jgi:hypothetical protein